MALEVLAEKGLKYNNVIISSSRKEYLYTFTYQELSFGVYNYDENGYWIEAHSNGYEVMDVDGFRNTWNDRLTEHELKLNVLNNIENEL